MEIRGRSVSIQLAVLVAIVAVPLTGLIAYDLYDSVRRDQEYAFGLVAQMAETTADRASRYVDNVRVALQEIAKRPLVRGMDPDNCDPGLADFREIYGHPTNIIVVNLEGRIVCGAIPPPRDRVVRISDDQLARAMVADPRFRLSKPLIGNITKRWIVTAVQPVFSPAGDLAGTVAMSIDLTNWVSFSPIPGEPDGTIHALVTADGIIIGRSVESGAWIGRNVSDGEIHGRMLEMKRGAVRADGARGADRVWGFTPVAGTEWYARSSVSASQVFGPSQRRLIKSAVLLAIVFAIAFAAAFFLIAGIARPMRAIAAALRSRNGGPGAVRVPVGGPNELVELAEAMNKSIESRASAERALRRAQDMAKLSHVVTGQGGSFESWSDSLPAMIGIADAQMPRSIREWLAKLHPDDRTVFRDKAIQAGRTGVRTDAEYRLLRADGGWLHIRQVMEPLQGESNSQGKLRWFNTLQDVTGQKRVEIDLRASEGLKRAILESSLECLIVINHEGNIVEFNPAAEATFGISREQALGNSMSELIIPPRLRAAHQRGFAHYFASGEGPVLGKRLELAAIRADGGEFPVELTITPIGARPTPMFAGSLRDITDRTKREEVLRRFRAAMDISGDAILLVDRKSMRYVDVNQTFCELVGYAREELIGMTPMSLFSASREVLERDYDAIIADRNAGASKVEGQYRHKNGSLIPIETRRRALHTEDGWIIVGTARDITDRKASEAKINRLNRVYAVLSGVNAAIVRIQDRAELFEEICRIANEAGQFNAVWVGVVDREAMLVKPVAWRGPEAGIKRLREQKFHYHADIPEGKSLVADAVRTRRAVISNDVRIDPRIGDREGLAALQIRSVAMLPLLLGNEAAGVFALHSPEVDFFDDNEMKLLLELAGDIAFALDHIEKAGRLDYLAYYDLLTGLANRTLFLERLSQFGSSAGAAGEKVALVLLDVERIRTINESLGRQTGDLLLKQLAGRLALVVDSGELARIGADVFAIVLPAVKGRSEVTRKVERVWQECFGQSFRLGESDVRIAAKAGMALYPSDGIDAETLMKNAEAALRRAKETGERSVFHALEMTAKTGEKLTLENSLRQALEKGEFVLHYQPKVDMETRGIVGVEALIRWQSPELGLVPPGRFIPLMEETGLILDVGAWALDKAIEDHFQWVKLGLPAPRVAVNVSAIQLRRRDFVFIVEDALTRGSTPPGIDLEITESLVMEDVNGNIEKLEAIRDLGVTLAIDDFGTGYSSLGYLTKLPVQTLKIDRSFIITMLKDPGAMTLVQTIISLAHSLRLKVVAEGVEEEEQAKLLRLLRCDEMQGYLFSRPVPFDQMTALLTRKGRP